jgi:UDP-N-acetyl-D-mannosaminuronic acid dehydrogenase
MNEKGSVLVVGLGHVGQPLAAVLAEAGFTVYGVDKNPEILERLCDRNSHVLETGLSELLARHLDKRLLVGPPESVTGISLDTTVISVESGYAKTTLVPDITSLKHAAAFVSSILTPRHLVIVRTTVPIGTTRTTTASILESGGLRAGKDFGLAYCPERIVEGAAIAELRRIPQIIGAIDQDSGDRAESIFRSVTPSVVRVSSLEAAEAVKLVDNAYRDTRFAFANTIAELCEQIKLNSWELIRAANLNYPRNSIPVPSPGVGGSCIPKDSLFLNHAARATGTQLPLIDAARQVNGGGPRRLIARLRRLTSLEGVAIFIAGFAFKGAPETGDLRESPTLALLEELKGTETQITGYDPVVGPEQIAALGVTPVGSLEAGLASCRVCVFMTNHQRFTSLTTNELVKQLGAGAIVVDGWGLFDPGECRRSGLTYLGVGVGE